MSERDDCGEGFGAILRRSKLILGINAFLTAYSLTWSVVQVSHQLILKRRENSKLSGIDCPILEKNPCPKEIPPHHVTYCLVPSGR